MKQLWGRRSMMMDRPWFEGTRIEHGGGGSAMALIRVITPTVKERQTVHEEVDCLASTFAFDGERYLQLETFGTNHRKISGKVSQSIQLDRESGRQLKLLLEQTFPDL